MSIYSPENRMLIIDDEPQVRDFLSTVSVRMGFEVQVTDNAETFFQLISSLRPTAILLDLNLPGSDGIELLRALSERQCRACIVVISGEDTRVITAAERFGSMQGLTISGALQKPVMLQDLVRTLRKIMRQTITESDLQEAIEKGELRVHYQPKMARHPSGAWKPAAAEALVRWDHQELGILPPKWFLPLAETAGLMAPLTDFVLREAIEQTAIWWKQDLPVAVAVNVGAELITDIEFPDRLSLLLQEYGLDGSRLSLEITESAAMENADTALDVLSRLRLKGIELAIDDFGTGYSSMKQLFCMPFSELKIDRSFVMECLSSGEARTMVKTMINLSENLGMVACAEGVENGDILSFLETARCPRVQGYYFREPVPAGKFERFAKDPLFRHGEENPPT